MRFKEFKRFKKKPKHLWMRFKSHTEDADSCLAGHRLSQKDY